MIELYHAPASTCSQKVRLCLAEKGLDWTERQLNLSAKEHLTPEYLALNPNGVVPTLVHDGAVITDSSVICEYVEEVFPDPPLMPADPARRAHLRAWMRFLEEVPTVAIRVPSFQQVIGRRFAKLDEAEFRRTEADVRPVRKHFYRQMGTKGFSETEISDSLDQLRLTLERMQIALEQGPWLMGAEYSLADIIVTPTIDRMADLGLASMWESDFLAIAGWYGRVRARPSFMQAYFPGSRLSDTRPVTAAG